MIKNWNLFRESVDEISKIHSMCKKYNIFNYTINDDFSINVDGNVDLSNRGLTKIPLKFNHIDGCFYFTGNKSKSLKFVPKYVSGDFGYSYNYLTELEFCPEYVGGDFYCRSNNLTSLEGLPKSIYGDIICEYNKIWSFRGIPDNFRGYLYCSGNPIDRIWKLFESSGDIEFFNDCHIVR